MKKCREVELANAVEKYLEDVGGVASIAQIRRALPYYVCLSDADRQQSLTRIGEQVWEQQVRNIVCHRHSEGNAVNNGVLKYRPGHLLLSDSPQGELFH